MSKPAPIRYRTLNWSAYNASLRERGSLSVWFDPSTPWHAAPSGKRGGQPVYSDAAIQAWPRLDAFLGQIEPGSVDESFAALARCLSRRVQDAA